MLQSIQDLINIDSHIKEVSSKRDELAERLKQLKDEEDDFINQMDLIEKRLDDATAEISSISNIAHIEPLRLKYGRLQVLDQIENLFRQKEVFRHETEVIEEIEKVSTEQLQSVDLEHLSTLKQRIVSLGIESMEVITRFNSLLEAIAKELMEKFKQDLLNSK